MHPVFKDIIIVIIAVGTILFWLEPDEEEYEEDPDTVTIEYRCSVIEEYNNVPQAVKEECLNRNRSNNSTENKDTI
jgi:hypothetical protein